MATGVKNTLVMGLLCAGVGLLVGLVIRQTAAAEDYQAFPVYALVAAFLAGAGLWWLLVAWRSAYGAARGILAGALAGVVSHFLCWYVMILAHNICYWGWGGCRSSLGEPPVDPLNGLWAAGLLSLGSLFFVGWLTIPAGGLIGGLLAGRQRRALRTSG